MGKTNNIYCGLDPGKRGAIVYIHPDGTIESYVVPLVGKAIDIGKLCLLMTKYNSVTYIVEKLHAIPRVASYTNFGLGKNVGVMIGIIAGTGRKFFEVAPQTWQKEMWQGVRKQYKPKKKGQKRRSTDTKKTSLLAAKKLFPNVDLTKSKRATVPHDGIVDALLIAEYGRRKNI